MKKSYTTLFIGLLTLLVYSCIDEITLNVDSDQQFVIVNGLISDVPGEVSVTVNNSPIIGVGNDNILVPISAAQVQLFENDNPVAQFVESLDEAGTYLAQFNGAQEGALYQIVVTLPDGSIVESQPQSIPVSNLAIDTIDFEIVPVEFINETGNVATNDFVEIYVNSEQIVDRAFLRWRVTGEYQIVEKAFGLLFPRNCYVKENIDFNRVTIADSETYSDGRVRDLPVMRLPMDSRFNIVYLFNVFQYTMSEAEYLYWSRIQELIDVEGTLFDPPPGILNGNLVNRTNPDERVQGYFSVVRQSFQRRFVDITQRGFFADTDCESRPNANNPEKCLDCTTLSRSTLEKPDYWRF